MIYILFALVLIGGLLLIYMYKQAHLNIVRKHEFSFSHLKLNKPIRLFFISDIHRRTIHPSIIDEVIGQVDVVIIGGDLLEKGVPLKRVHNNLEKLRRLGPIYFVWGNNDKEVLQVPIMSLFRKNGVQVLKNTSATIFHDNKGFSLIGVDDMNTGLVDLETALSGVNESSFKILVSHDPRVLSLIEPQHKISLVLSGHTHGGQIRIFGFGPYEMGKTHISKEVIQIVSNGYGTTALPLRLQAKPEAHHIIIESY
ncbi:metallophosphoesterase [Bacillus sp. EAC]|uniref:metallophosphoesterase n=1 Tax=Bacillus sp. EAC TaxID=1978338 RepID=UPI000B44E519|nr:metallophosphoesterase [Bacillus sp. EAC]